MIGAYCTSLRRDLAAFVDGELRGDRMLGVLSHLECCTECSEHVRALRELGDGLRAEAPAEPPAHYLDGLASTVISRTKAETQLSWRAKIQRAHEDWHWPLVGAGALVATFGSFLLVSAILAFGPRPERDDSLFAIIENYGTSAGTMFLYAAPVGDEDAQLVQVEDGNPNASRATRNLAERSAYRAPSEAQLVDALAEILMRHGRIVPLDRLNASERSAALFLLQEISRIRAGSLAFPVTPDQLRVIEVRMVTSTTVSAGL
jgi:hypothetical protein